MPYIAVSGSERKNIQTIQEAISLKKIGYQIFTADLNETELSEQELQNMLLQEVTQQVNQQQNPVSQKEGFFQKYWLHIILIIAIIILIITIGYFIWPTLRQGYINIRSVPL